MDSDKRWVLPVGVEEDLPPMARRIEQLRRRVLDLFEVWGYDLVTPPLIEYLESLLITGDESLELQTLKLVDQLNGRMMGVRADMTPQVARIDARMPSERSVNRLCYVGTTLKARPDGVRGTRSPLQFGAEIYGDAGGDADAEIIRLMLVVLFAIGIRDVHIDLGHVGICSSLFAAAGLNDRQGKELSDLLNKKAIHELCDYLDAQAVSAEDKACFAQLLELHGGRETLDKARELFADVDGVGAALDELKEISASLSAIDVEPHYDLAELRGYHYKTGVVFAAFTPGVGREIARGGRYDDIGRVFGRARPATGFSGDLKLLAGIVADYADNDDAKKSVFAPRITDAALDRAIDELRAQGVRVVRSLHRDDMPAGLACQRELILQQGKWIVTEV